jgi:hypothetical protein
MIIEKNIQVEQVQAELLNDYAKFGFASQQELIAFALQLLQQELEKRQQVKLEESADLYAGLYDADEETKSWTNAALGDWK